MDKYDLNHILCEEKFDSLSKEAIRKIKYWHKNLREDRKTPDWDTIFLRQAYEWREKSHDAQTQHGAVLVKNKRIISSGYNGFVQGIQDDILPNLRDPSGNLNDKHVWMIHSEHSAILDCAKQGRSAEGSTMYVTGKPCLNCCQFMYQAGVVEVVYGNTLSNMIVSNPDYEINLEIFLWLAKDKFKLRYVDYPKFS